MKTLTLKQAAELLQVNPETLRIKAVAGEVPAANVGHRWIFLEEDLVEWLRSLYVKPVKNQTRSSVKKSVARPLIEMISEVRH